MEALRNFRSGLATKLTVNRARPDDPADFAGSPIMDLTQPLLPTFIPCTLGLYPGRDAAKTAQILPRHTVVGLLKRHDHPQFYALSDIELAVPRLQACLSN